MPIFAAATLSLRLTQNNPTADPIAPSSRADRTLGGILTVKLSRPTVVKKLVVVFRGEYSTAHLSRSYDVDLIQRTHEIDVFKRLPAGDHSFSFEFVLPSSIATSESSSAGQIVYRVTAKAPGLGYLGSSLTASKKVVVVACPAQPSALADGPLLMHAAPFDYIREGCSSEIGPYCFQAQSDLLCIGGVLRYSLHLSEPPAGLQIMKTEGTMRQRITVTLPGGRKVVKPLQDRRVCIVDAKHPEIASPISLPQKQPQIHQPAIILRSKWPLARLSKQAWTLEHYARIPGNDLLHATTLAGTRTPIRVEHTLAFDVVYQTLDGRERKMTVTSPPVELLSCCCRRATIVLPTYEECPKPFEDKDIAPCSCGPTIIERSATSLLRVASASISAQEEHRIKLLEHTDIRPPSFESLVSLQSSAG